jgi:hypothetical protein
MEHSVRKSQKIRHVSTTGIIQVSLLEIDDIGAVDVKLSNSRRLIECCHGLATCDCDTREKSWSYQLPDAAEQRLTGGPCAQLFALRRHVHRALTVSNSSEAPKRVDKGL